MVSLTIAMVACALSLVGSCRPLLGDVAGVFYKLQEFVHPFSLSQVFRLRLLCFVLVWRNGHFCPSVMNAVNDVNHYVRTDCLLYPRCDKYISWQTPRITSAASC